MLFGRVPQSVMPARPLLYLWGAFVVVLGFLLALGAVSWGRAGSVLLTATGTLFLADAIQPTRDVDIVAFQHGISWGAIREYVDMHNHVGGPMGFKPVSYYGGLALLLAGILLAG